MTSRPEIDPFQPSAILIHRTTDMRGHAETVTTAVEVTRDTTVGELIDRHLRERDPWGPTAGTDGATQYHYRGITDAHIEIRPII